MSALSPYKMQPSLLPALSKLSLSVCCSFFLIITVMVVVVIQSPSVSSFTLTISHISHISNIKSSTTCFECTTTSFRNRNRNLQRQIQGQKVLRVPSKPSSRGLLIPASTLLLSNPNNDNENNDNKNSSQEQPSKENDLLNDNQIDFTMGYLNKHHTDVLILFVQAFTQLGATQVKKNAFSGGSYEITNAKLIGIDYFGHRDGSCHVSGNEKDEDTSSKVGFLTLEAMVQIRSEKEPKLELVTVPLGTSLSFSRFIHVVILIL